MFSASESFQLNGQWRIKSIVDWTMKDHMSCRLELFAFTIKAVQFGTNAHFMEAIMTNGLIEDALWQTMVEWTMFWHPVGHIHFSHGVK